MQRWRWDPEPSRDEDAVNICPVDVREVELQRGGASLELLGYTSG